MNHIVTVVLAETWDHPIGRSFRYEGCTKIYEFRTLDEATIDDFRTFQDNGNVITLRINQRQILKFLLRFDIDARNVNPAFHWTQVTKEEFERYRTHYCSPHNALGSSSRPTAPRTPFTTTSSSTAVSKVDQFDKGVKRNKDDYDELRHDRDWKDWHQKFTIQAMAHNLQDVLDPNYRPTDADEANLFKRKQVFMMTVLLDKIKTTDGKTIVNKHRVRCDARRALSDLFTHYGSSTVATLRRDKLLTWLTSVTFSNSRWRGTYLSFINHFDECLDEYHSLVPDYLPPDVQLTLLQNSVADVPALNEVKRQLQIIRVATRKYGETTYTQYMHLLKHAATILDEKQSRRSSRYAYVHEQEDADYDNHDSGADTSHDDDHDHPTHYDVNRHRTQRVSNHNLEANLNRTQWKSLSPEAQKRWDEFSREEKEIITNPSSPAQTSDQNDAAGPSDKSPNRMAYRPPPPRTANKHELTTDDTQDQPSSNHDDTLDPHAYIAMLTDVRKPADEHKPPGDVNRLLSANKNKTSTSKSRSAYMAVTYIASSHTRHRHGSLVDRGANGGIAGNDMTIIEDTGRTVNISGIDDHQLTDLKIVTAGGVVQSQHGPIILVCNQYAYNPGAAKSIHSSPQLEHYKVKVDDRALAVGGKQCLKTLEGHVIPLDIHQGLPYLKIRPFTKTEYDELEHCHVTSGTEWDPSVLDKNLSDDKRWYSKQPEERTLSRESKFDEFGDYKHRTADVHLHNPTLQSHYLNLVKDEGYESDDSTIVPDVPELSLRPLQQHLHSDSDSDSEDESDDELPGLAVRPRNTESDSDADDDRDHPSHRPIARRRKAYTVDEHVVTKNKPDYDEYRDFFLGQTTDNIKKTFDATTQHARRGLIPGLHVQRWYRSPNPAMNIKRRNEPVATDTIFSDTPAHGSGAKCAQIFVGRHSRVADCFAVKTDKQFVNALEDVIRKRGAMDKLISDGAKAETGEKVKDVLRSLCIEDWQSEPHHQWQNYAERQYQNIKSNTNRVMNRFGVPAKFWYLAMCYVIFIMNRMALGSLNWRTPIETLTGETPDISMITRFRFYEPVYYKKQDSGFPSESTQRRGRFLGFSENVGHAMTFIIVDDATNATVERANVWSVLDPDNLNLRADRENDPQDPSATRDQYMDVIGDGNGFADDLELNPSFVPFVKGRGHVIDSSDLDGDMKKKVDKSLNKRNPSKDDNDNDTPSSDKKDNSPSPPQVETTSQDDGDNGNDGQDPLPNLERPMPTFDPTDMKGRTFLAPPLPDGTINRVKVIDPVDAIHDHDNKMKGNPIMHRFRCKRPNSEVEEIYAYNELCDLIESSMSEEGVWKFERILDHRGTGRSIEVLIKWSTGEQTWEPLTTICKTDPITPAIYARDNDLFGTYGWKHLRRHAKNDKKLVRLVNQAKLRSFRTAPRFKYGVELPRDHDYYHALELDEKYGHNKWQTAAHLEMSQLDEYDTFHALPKGSSPPPGYKKIRVHLVWDVKASGKHKCRCVADGHLTAVPVESVYSSVVSLRGIRAIAFIAELNDLELWGTDIGNAYLCSKTREKCYIIAGPEFGPEREGRILIIHKALYGMKSSGARWHERFFDVLKDDGWTPSKAEADIWMRRRGDHYEYIGVYVDDLAIASRNPQAVIDMLEKTHGFKLKGTGPLEFHLGCDFVRDPDGILSMAPKKYIQRMIDNYVLTFGCQPSTKVTSPLEKGDHPEIDTSPELDAKGIQQYQSIIGSLQWAISLGRFDIATAVATLSSFRSAPREGHLKRARRIVGYLAKMKEAKIRFRADKPDYSDLVEPDVSWAHTVYGDVKEIIPDDIPEPLGNDIILTTYFDANLYHDMVTGRAMTGVLHFVNKTVFDWYAKKQATVETATYGSEFVAGRTAVEQIMDIRLYFRYLGVPIDGKTRAFGDNESMTKSGTLPHSTLNKRHNALSYHRVREAIASNLMSLSHISGSINPADVLSKHWGYSDVWPQLKAILFWSDPTTDTDHRKGGDKMSVEPRRIESSETSNEA